MVDDTKTINILTDKLSETTCSQCGCEIDVEGLEPFLMVECPDCGSRESVPCKLGQFLLLNLIGTGGMGGVYYAKDTTLGRYVAIKVMLKSLGEDIKFVETFKREAQAAARLNHPSIAQIYSFGQEKGQPYIVMELIQGQGLDRMLEKRGKVDQHILLKIALQIAQGLQAANEINLVHGDIKPENILLTKKGQAKLVDFGLATFAHQGESDGIWGTPYYISPEKILREKSDARSDIYSLGATLYHAITGVPPFEGKTPVDVVKARLKHAPAPIKEYAPQTSPDVIKLISRMMEIDKAKRHPNYKSLLNDIKRAFVNIDNSKTGSGKIKTASSRLRISSTNIRSASGRIKSSSNQFNITTGTNFSPIPSKKITIKRRKISPGSAISTARHTTTAPAVTSTSSNIEALLPKQPDKKRSKKALWIFLVILILAGGITGGLYWKDNHDKKFAALRERIMIKTNLKTIQKVYANFQTVTNSIAAINNSSQSYADLATNAVFIVLGEALETASPATETQNAKQEEKSTGASDSKPTDNASPAGIVSPEELRKQKQAEQNHDQATPDNAKLHSVIENNTEPSKPEPKIKTEAKKVITSNSNVHSLTHRAPTLIAEAVKIYQDALVAKSSSVIAGKTDELNAHIVDLKEMETKAKEWLTKTERYYKNVATIKDDIDKRREATRLATLKAEEARKKAEEAARLQKEHKEKVQSELVNIRVNRGENKEFLNTYDFDKALRSAKRLLPKLETKEGKDAAQRQIDRYKRLLDMKAFLIDRLNKSPFRLGWGSGRMARSITGANEDYIILTGGSKERWNTVTSTQMIRFLRHYLNEPETKKITLRAIAEQNLNAAIYCLENGFTEGIDIFKTKSITAREHMRDENERLLTGAELEQ